jgi:O-antigen/teichoic acid export membrane protein
MEDNKMRSKKAALNMLTSLLLQMVSIICGLIAPRLIIETFGSGINGVTASISQFLGYIVLLEAGVGGVVRAALYKPLADKDVRLISGIVRATEKFFRVIAFIFIGYSVAVAFLYPLLVNDVFDYIFTLTLVLIISASTFTQYYFGVAYQIVLQADQQGYITSFIQVFTTLINTILVVLFIKLGAGIHLVQFGSACIYVVRPIVINALVSKKYKLIKDCAPDNNAIRQRWNGLGHHIAFFLHTNTDIVVLTLFTNVKEVSVYSVYYMVISAVKRLTTTFSSGLEAAFGNMIAKEEKESLDRNFPIFEFLSYTLTTILFTTTALSIMPFLSVYTREITDYNYTRPLFAYILIAAEAVYCIRIPYHDVVLAAGHFKQTRNGAFLESIINIILSVVLVNIIGIEGAAIGTFCAMLFRTVQYAVYLSRHILERSVWVFVKRFAISVMTVIIIIVLYELLPHSKVNSYITWLIHAMMAGVMASAVTLTINAIFYADNLRGIWGLMKKLIPTKGR